MPFSRPAAVSALLAVLLLAGCRITNDKNGKNDNVDISTPFGSMKVKTNDNVDTSSIGITAYPGAVPVKDQDKDDDHSADINLSFGDFHLGVKAAGFQTSDQPDKVLAFYRKDLARYGDVIECKGDSPVGAGSETHQHIVSIEAKNGGTCIGLVQLNLPSQIHSNDGKNPE